MGGCAILLKLVIQDFWWIWLAFTSSHNDQTFFLSWSVNGWPPTLYSSFNSNQ